MSSLLARWHHGFLRVIAALASRRVPFIGGLLILSLVGGAYLTASAVTHPHLAWVGWITLFPLLTAIRVQRPLRAMVSGLVWGLSLVAFLHLGRGPYAATGFTSFALLAAVPGFYACLASHLTRRIGFSPLVLGVGWMGVELALAPLGLHHGLLAGTQGNAWLLQVVGHLFGYVLVAFIVAYVSALVVTAVAEVRVGVPAARRRPPTTERVLRLIPQTFSSFSRFSIHPSQPRAPPVS